MRTFVCPLMCSNVCRGVESLGILNMVAFANFTSTEFRRVVPTELLSSREATIRPKVCIPHDERSNERSLAVEG